jgi:hypothetical protein
LRKLIIYVATELPIYIKLVLYSTDLYFLLEWLDFVKGPINVINPRGFVFL